MSLGTGRHPERIDPRTADSGIVALHLARYRIAVDLAAGSQVLDVGCGLGYGAEALSSGAARVVGLDVSEEAIQRAAEQGHNPRVAFLVADATALPLRARSFDLVCCFEVLEHLVEPRRFLHELARVLTDDGVALLSTPAAEVTTHRPNNPFHHREWAPDDLRSLLLQFFEQVELSFQTRSVTRRARLLKRVDVLRLRERVPRWILRSVSRLGGVRATPDLRLEDVRFDPQPSDHVEAVLATCRAAHGGRVDGDTDR